MKCKKCKVEMKVERILEDFNDPGSYGGHGQRAHLVLICPKCKVIDNVPNDIDIDEPG